MVETVIYMFVALLSLTSALKISKKYNNQTTINENLAFLVHASISALMLLTPYTALKTWLVPEYAFATTILIIAAMTAVAKRRRNV